MSSINDFYVIQNDFIEQMADSVRALNEDIKNLNAKVMEIQSSPGEVTQDDQKLLNDLQVQAEQLADSLHTLDKLTPPKFHEDKKEDAPKD